MLKRPKRPVENTPNLTKTKGDKVQNTFKPNLSHAEDDIQKSDIKANKHENQL